MLNNLREKITTRELSILSALAALSITVQLIHIGYRSPTGIWVDLVAVFWLMAYFLYGTRGALITSVIGFLVISLTQPDTWIGASMKWIASFLVWISFVIFLQIIRKKREIFEDFKYLIFPIILGIILRGIAMVYLNYYYAIPIWIPGTTPEQAMEILPWHILIGLNAIQTLVDVILAWVFIFKFKLKKFGNFD
jgi:riboflavin transporter FmnP